MTIEPGNAKGITINGVDVERVARMVDAYRTDNTVRMMGEWAAASEAERYIAHKAAGVLDEMTREGYGKEHIKAHMLRTIANEAQRVGPQG